MTGPATAIPLNDNGDEEAGAEAPRIFVRVINTHPGSPWSQSQQATLEARLGAPGRLDDIAYRIRRLDRWRPGGPARFAAVYARAEDVRRGFVATRTVEGRPLTVDFTSPMGRALRLRGAVITAGPFACSRSLSSQPTPKIRRYRSIQRSNSSGESVLGSPPPCARAICMFSTMALAWLEVNSSLPSPKGVRVSSACGAGPRQIRISNPGSLRTVATARETVR